MKLKSSTGELITVPDGMEEAAFKAQAEGKLKQFADGLKKRMKSGGMIKRKDGSYSRRGLWDNIRANRGSGRKPTKEMLRQEKKIRAKAEDGMLVGDQEPQENFGPVKKKTYTPSKETLFQEYFRLFPERPETDSLLEHTSPGSALAGYIGTTICDEKGCRPYNPSNLSEERRMELYRKAWQEKYRQGFDPSTRSRRPYDKRLLELFPPDPNKPSGKVLGPNGEVLRDYGPPSPTMNYFSPDFIHWWDEVDDKGNKIRPKQAAGGTVFKGYVTEQPMGDAVPFHTSTIGRKMNDGGGVYPLYNSDYTYTISTPGESDEVRTFGTEKSYNKYIAKLLDNQTVTAFDLEGNPVSGFGMRRFPGTRMTQPGSERMSQSWEGFDTPEDYMFTEFPVLKERIDYLRSGTVPDKYGKGGYTVKRSSARKGKTHVVIGPDGTKKYFGDSKLGQHPGNPKRKKSFYARHAKNLKKNPYFRAFARATWDDGGKLTANMYDQGIMPYDFGGPVHMAPSIYGGLPSHSTAYRMAAGGMLPSGLMRIPVGYGTPAYNERYDLGGDIGAGLTGIVGGALGTVPLVGGMLQQGVNSLGEKIQGPLSDQEKAIRGFGSAAGGIGAGLATGNIGGAISQGGSGLSQGISAMSPESAAAQGIAQGLNVAGTLGGMAAGMGAFGNAGAGNALKFNEAIKGTRFGNTYGALNKASAFNPLMSFAQNASNIKMADGGQSGLVPINVEGADFSEGSGPDARKGELLVLNGRIIKNYVGRPPHPAEGQNPLGNDDAPEGLIVIPKARTKEYLEAGLTKRKQMERSLVSQQQDREMKKSRKMGDGGYYSFGMGEMGMGEGGDINTPNGNPENIESMMGYGYKKGGWIQKVTKSIKRRGTEGVCTGSKFGSSSCPPGSRRYNLAKTFRKMAKARKHEYGGRLMYENRGRVTDPNAGIPQTYRDAQGIEHPTPSYLHVGYDWNPTPGSDSSAVKSFYDGAGKVFQQTGYFPETPQFIEDMKMDMSLKSVGEGKGFKFPEGRYILYKGNPNQIKRHGGFVDPVTGSHTVMYGEGGKLPAGILRSRMEASGKSDAAIQNYMNNYYEMGGPVNVDKSLVYEGMQNRAMAKNGMITSMPMRRRYDVTSFVAPYAEEVMSPRQQAIMDYVNSGRYISGSNTFDNSVPTQVNEPIDTRQPIEPIQKDWSGYSPEVTAKRMEREALLSNALHPAYLNRADLVNYNPTPYTPSSNRLARRAAANSYGYSTIPEDIRSQMYQPGSGVLQSFMGPTPEQRAAQQASSLATLQSYGTPSPYSLDLANYYNLPAQKPTINDVEIPYRDYKDTPGTSLPSWMLPQNATSPTSYDYSSGLGDIYGTARKDAGYDETLGTNAPPLGWKGIPYRMEDSKTPSTTQSDWANIASDAMRAAPIVANLIGAVSKRQYLKPEEFMQKELPFRATRFDETPYREATSRALYDANMGIAGRTALASQMAGARSQGYQGYRNQEALRRSQLDAMNAQIQAQNIGRRLQIDDINRRIRSAGQAAGTAAATAAGQIGAENEYLRVLAGQQPRKMFTGWRTPNV